MIDRSWVEEASCRNIGWELFFPAGDTWDPVEVNMLRQICKACPVQQRCLDYAMTLERGLSRGYRHGIYGGLTANQRTRLSRRRGEEVLPVQDDEPITAQDEGESAA